MHYAVVSSVNDHRIRVVVYSHVLRYNYIRYMHNVCMNNT